MKFNSIILLAIMFGICSAAIAGNGQAGKKNKKAKPVYGFGYSFSITDSTVYFTDILELPEAKLQKKTKFLEHRQMYSDQFKNYLEHGDSALSDRTCTVFFSKNHASLKSIYLRIRRRNTIDKEITKVHELTADQFKFKALEVDDENQ